MHFNRHNRYDLHNAIYIVALLFTSFCAAQDYSFDHFDPIKALKKDNDGIVYLVTDNAICKFLGTDNQDDCFYVKHKIDNAIIQSDGHFYVSHNDTLWTYKDFEPVDEIVTKDPITALASFDDKVIIGASEAGAYSYDNASVTQFLKDDFVNDLASTNEYLYAITDDELFVFDRSLNTITRKSFNAILEKIVVLENSIAILTLTSDIIFLTDQLELEKIYKPNNLTIDNLLRIDHVLFAISKSSLLKWNTEGFQLVRQTDIPAKYSIASQHSIVTASDNQIILYNPLTTTYDLNSTFSIFAEQDQFWLGREGEIAIFKNAQVLRTIQLPEQFKSTFVSSLVVYNEMIYAGTMGNGILLLDKSSGEYLGKLEFQNTSPTRQNIIQMHVSGNSLWIGYLNGLEVIDLQTNELISDHTQLLKNNYLYQFYVIGSNEFYLCTSDAGLVHQKNGKTSTYLDGKTIYGIERSGSGFILSVEEEGLYILKDTLEKLSDKVYLSSSNIYNMLAIDDKIIIGHNDAVDLVDLATNEVDYLAYNKTLGQSQLNSKATGQTKILMAFENALVEFDKSFISSTQHQHLKLENPLLFNDRIDSIQGSYAYNENTWTFNYTGTNYLNPEDIYYKYRLNPIEKDWITTTQQGITYYNLPPGEYSFEVTSGGHRNFVPQNIRSYNLKILSPVWQNPVFWVMVFLLMAIAVFSFIKYREKQIKKQEALKNLKLEFEYQRLKDQINPHFLFNSFNSLIGVVEENPKQGTKILEKLSDLYRSILKHEKSEVISLAEELQLAETYFEIHKLRFQDLIKLHLAEIENTEGKFVIPFSVQLLVENAIKHNVINSKHKLDIYIFEEDDYLVIKNTLKEKKQNSGSLGLGLENLNKRHDMKLSRLPVVKKTKEAFIVKIPIINA